MKTIITLLTLLLVSSGAEAIDKKFHPKITNQALEHFKTCAKELSLRDFNAYERDRIATYTAKEDDASLDRITNWHFYDKYTGTEYAMPEHKSLHRIFNHRIEKFSAALKYDVNREVLSNAGRIIHYLQDAGIPAHVAPNYHAKPNEWYERIFTKDKGDPFDSLMDPALNSYTIDAKGCRDLYNTNSSEWNEAHSTKKPFITLFNNLLVELAEKTRDTIQKTYFPGSDKSFEYEFWNLRSVKQGHNPAIDTLDDFAAYGHNDRNRFSAKHYPCNENEANQEKCRTFITGQYKEIMDTTIRALMYINEIRTKKP